MSKKLEVQPFTRTDIQKIVEPDFAKVAGLVKNTVESYPVWDFTLFPDFGNDSKSVEITQERLDLVQKCFEAGKLNIDEYPNFTLLHINYAEGTSGKLTNLCFGCTTAQSDGAHLVNGVHLEIVIDYENNEMYASLTSNV